MSIIDVHTHMYTHDYMELLNRSSEFSVVKRSDGAENIFQGDDPIATAQPGHFDYDIRFKDMDAGHVDMAIISLTTPNVYWGGPDLSPEVARTVNDGMATAQTTWPDRIRFFASLPWQYPDQAIAELEHACHTGAVGVIVMANIAGRSLTDPLFAPVWEEIDRRGLPVLVHPTDPQGAAAMDMSAHRLFWSVGFITDTTLAFARLILNGFLDRYPNLKLIALHGGGALPYLIGRFDRGYEKEPPSSRRAQEKPSYYLTHKIFYDCITYDAQALQYLISVVGADRVLYGTDYPHEVNDMKGSYLHTQTLDDTEQQMIRQDNAKKLFNL